MNNKLLATVFVAGTAFAVSGVFTTASAMEVNSENGEQGNRPFIQKMMDRDGEHGGMKGIRGHKGGMMKDVMSNLDEATQTKLQELHDAHRTEIEALKEQYGDDKEAFRDAAETLRESHMEQLKEILPADMVAQMAEHKGEMKGKGHGPMIDLDLTDEQKEAMQTLREKHMQEIDSLKEQYGDDREAFRDAAETLRETHMNEVKQILPAEAVEKLEAHHAEMEAKRDEMKTEHQEMRVTKASNRMQGLTKKLDMIQEKVGEEKAQEVFSTLIVKLQEKATSLNEKASSMDDASNLNEVIELLNALIDDLQSRIN